MGKAIMRCAYCDKETDDLHRDHVVPRSRGGPDDATNIVMACAECNRSKRDSTAVEWLDGRCPKNVADIEARVNKKLKARFEKRDKKPFRHAPVQEPPKLYALHINADKQVGYVGEVIEERGDYIRIEAADPICMWAGLWSLSGSLYDIKRSDVRLFNDLATCISTASRMLDQCCPRREKAHA